MDDGCASTLIPPIASARISRHSLLGTSGLGRGSSLIARLASPSPPFCSCGYLNGNSFFVMIMNGPRDRESLSPAESRGRYFAGEVQHKTPNITDTVRP